MRVFTLFLILYAVSSSEQKPLDEKDLTISTEKSTSVIDEHATLNHERNGVPTTVGTLIVNTEETNILKAPASTEETRISVNNGTNASVSRTKAVATSDHDSSNSSNPGVNDDEAPTTSLPSPSGIERIAETVITDIVDVVEDIVDRALPVIPIDEISSTTVTPLPTDSTQSTTLPATSDDTVEETSSGVESNSSHNKENSTAVKHDEESSSLLSPALNSSGILVAAESSSNELLKCASSASSDSEQASKDRKSVKDANATEITSAVSTTSDSKKAVDATEIVLLETVVEDISDETDSITNTNSTIDTTEVPDSEEEALGAQLIQDLLDPAIVLAKRSLISPEGADDSNHGEKSSNQKLKAIASSASNTWGLFLLVLLLGYALVEVPRGLWNASKPGYTLHYSYFKAAKLSLEKCEAEETVDDVLESLQAASIAIGVGHPFHRNLETIFQKVPAELKDRMNRRQLPDDTPTDSPSEKSLIRLHKHTIKSLQTLQRTETQWGILIEKIFHLEDVAKNQASHDRRFKPTFPVARAFPVRLIYNPTVEWYWKCVIKSYAQKLAAFAAGVLSMAVVWSEVTFFNESPVLSLFAQFVQLATVQYDYFTIEVLSTLIIAYLCYCAYSTVLKIRVLNLYYLAPHHQTNEYSLIFSGMMLCRLTPPMCLNFLGLIHMDSHIIKTQILETHYTQVMGHMDVISIISDGFNVYFPMAILAFCLATYFSLGSRLLSMLGFQQFLGDDELTTDLVEEGRELIKRERRKRQRAEDSMSRRREFQERFNNLGTASRYRTARQSTDTVRPLRRDESTESARAGLLRDVESTDYYVGTPFENDRYIPNNNYSDQGYQAEIYHDLSSDNLNTYTSNSNRVGPPPRGLFDDI